MKSVSKKKQDEFAKQVLRAMKRAAKAARKIARMHGTPIAIVHNGKVITQKP